MHKAHNLRPPRDEKSSDEKFKNSEEDIAHLRFHVRKFVSIFKKSAHVSQDQGRRTGGAKNMKLHENIRAAGELSLRTNMLNIGKDIAPAFYAPLILAESRSFSHIKNTIWEDARFPLGVKSLFLPLSTLSTFPGSTKT